MQNECVGEGGFLASIHDAETNEFLVGIFEHRSYIGGVYENGLWTWTDGSVWDYENWRAGDPTNFDLHIQKSSYLSVFDGNFDEFLILNCKSIK